MNDVVFWGSIGAVVFSVVVLIYLVAIGIKKINTDHSED